MSDDNADDVSDTVQTTPGASRGVGKNEMVDAYLPNEDHWAAKTDLDQQDPARVAALRQFEHMFPEVEELQPVLDGFLDEYLPAKTSVEKNSRNEYQSIFEAMFGAGSEESKSGQMLAQALGADPDDE